MNPYIENLKAFLKEQSSNFAYTDAESLLEMLYYYYTSDNPIDNGVIRCQLRQVNAYTEKLSLADSDSLFDAVSSLCAQHEKVAFLKGIQVGAHLAEELSAL